MPERFFGFLYGFVMVWEAAAPKPLQNHAKNPKAFPAFANTFQNLSKKPKPQKPLRLRKPSRKFLGRLGFFYFILCSFFVLICFSVRLVLFFCLLCVFLLMFVVVCFFMSFRVWVRLLPPSWHPR